MQQERESADLCINGCGFFGAPANGGMCSVCWKKTVSKRQVETDNAASPRAETAAPSTVEEVTIPEAEVAAPAAVADAEEEKEPEKLVQKNKKRCWSCRKKVGLAAIECRCGYVFCGSHRYPDQHDCSFDFKKADRAELARRNPGGGEFGKLEKL